MLSATASARSRPLSLHSSRRATRFVPSERTLLARPIVVVTGSILDPGANLSEGLLKANSREWLGRLRRPEPGDHVAGDGGTADLFRIVLAAGSPHPGFVALDRQL